MNKPIKSRDPRKSCIVHALKMASGANKVTLVRDEGNNVFSGYCMSYIPSKKVYSDAVRHQVTISFDVDIDAETDAALFKTYGTTLRAKN